MRRAQILLGMAAVVLGLSSLAGCGKKKESEPIPITTVSQSMVDDEPDDKIEVSEEEIQPEYEVELPEGPDSFTLALWDEIYEIPMSFEAFAEMGWEYSGDEEGLLEAQTYSAREVFSRDGNQLMADLVNPDTRDCTIRESQIGGISIDAGSPEGQGIYVTLPGNLVLLESNLSQVLNLYGEPMDRYEGENSVELTYEFGLYQNMSLAFEKESEILFRVELQNILLTVEKEDLGEVSSEVTEEVLAYQAPAEAGSTLADYIVEYDGDYYQLPAPVSAFTEHGWKIDKESSDAALAAGTYGSVTLEKGNAKIYGSIHNEGTAATTVENCFLTLLSGDLDAIRVPISIAGINLGMEEEEMLRLTAECSYETSEDLENNRLLYCFYTDESRLNYVEIQVDTTFHLVRGIRVSNQILLKEAEMEEDADLQTTEKASEALSPAAEETSQGRVSGSEGKAI